MDYDLIYAITSSRRMSFNELCKSIGMTHSGLKKAITSKTLRVDTLEKIASVLEVNVCEFFIGSPYPSAEPPISMVKDENQVKYSQQIGQLKDQLRDKEKIIKLLEKQLIIK